jgi:hypothetical protein
MYKANSVIFHLQHTHFWTYELRLSVTFGWLTGSKVEDFHTLRSYARVEWCTGSATAPPSPQGTYCPYLHATALRSSNVRTYTSVHVYSSAALREPPNSRTVNLCLCFDNTSRRRMGKLELGSTH